MQWHLAEFTVDDDPARLDMAFILRILQATYWGQAYTAEKVATAFANSMVFGVYDPFRQVGIARVVTDKATVSWVCDVVISPDVRDKGLGRFLMQCIFDHPDIAPTRQMLNTRTAHGFYKRLGFVRADMLVR